MSAYGKSMHSTHHIKYITIPRIELVPENLSVKVPALLQKEFQLLKVKETFWTDSEVVLGYIRNESRCLL